MKRRDFLKISVAALGGVTFCSDLWAATPLTGWLSGFKDRDGKYGLAHIDDDLNAKPLFYTPIRLHGISRHPSRNLIVAPARRPDRLLFVFDLERNSVDTITAAPGRHFYGHGCFNATGDTYYTTESAYDEEKGIIGLYDVNHGFKRIGEWDSGGIGPHEITRYQDKLIIANGGILTHPDLGRAKLNIDDMAPNLARLDIKTGRIEQDYRLPEELHHLSIRHLDVSSEGTVFVGLQDQLKGRRDVPLVWQTRSDKLVPMDEPKKGWKAFKGYIGSVSSNQGELCVSSPRGHCIHIWGQQKSALHHETDVCGVAPLMEGGFMMTSGQGKISARGQTRQHALNFDNHCL